MTGESPFPIHFQKSSMQSALKVINKTVPAFTRCQNGIANRLWASENRPYTPRMPSDAVQLAFVTYSSEPEIAVDDLPLARELEKRGVVVSARPWGNSRRREGRFSPYKGGLSDRAPSPVSKRIFPRPRPGESRVESPKGGF